MNYKQLPCKMSPLKNTDSDTDYFENDGASGYRYGDNNQNISDGTDVNHSRSRHQSNQSNHSNQRIVLDDTGAEENGESTEDRGQLCPVGTAATKSATATTNGTTNESLSAPDIIEIMKNLAAYKEKQYKWEQSAEQLASFPDSDPNKSQMMEIIDFVENNQATTKEKAITLYEQLALKCHQNDNYIGSAKAYERAAALHYEHFETESADKKESIAFATIRCLEEAIRNYSAIHKYKHAGTLHYRCSIILKLIKADPDQVERHHIKALEYFTKPDHELKHRKRIDGLKISCYSSYSSRASRLTRGLMNDQNENFTTTTTTTTNTIKFHADRCYRNDSDDSDSNHSPSPPLPSSSNQSPESIDAKNLYGDDYHNSYPVFGNFLPIGSKGEGSPFFDDKLDLSDVVSLKGPISSQADSPEPPTDKSKLLSQQHHFRQRELQSSLSTSSLTSADHHHQSSKSHSLHSSSYVFHHHKKQKLSASTLSNPVPGPSSGSNYGSCSGNNPGASSSQCSNNSNYNNNKNTFRCIEDRIESARKLVKKLNKVCPFYEVSFNGDDAGRVYCKICDRYLGAVSSTLKNHLNTQEHRQAYEDSQPQPPAPLGQEPGTISGYIPLQPPPTGVGLSHPHHVPSLSYSNFAGLVPGISPHSGGQTNSASQSMQSIESMAAASATSSSELQSMMAAGHKINSSGPTIAQSTIARYQQQQQQQQQISNNCEQSNNNIDSGNKKGPNSGTNNSGKQQQSVIYLDYESINATSETQLTTAVGGSSVPPVSGSNMLPSGSDSWNSAMTVAGQQQQQQQQQFDSSNNSRNSGNSGYPSNPNPNQNLQNSHFKPSINLGRTAYGQQQSYQLTPAAAPPPGPAFIIPPPHPHHSHHHPNQSNYFPNSTTVATPNNMTVHAYN